MDGELKELKRGDPVTHLVMSLWDPDTVSVQLAFVRRVFDDDDGARCFETVRGADSDGYGYHLANEGVTWIREHHAPDSSEVRALFTAYALL